MLLQVEFISTGPHMQEITDTEIEESIVGVSCEIVSTTDR